jgi:hypothetical protein
MRVVFVDTSAAVIARDITGVTTIAEQRISLINGCTAIEAQRTIANCDGGNLYGRNPAQ